MISDEIVLSGLDAYLRRADGSAALQSGDTGASVSVEKGGLIDINAVEVLLEADDLLALMNRRQAPLIEVQLKKQVYPGLFADPHSHRVHQVAGEQDFRQAKSSDMTIMEFDRTTTLVSPGSQADCQWVSGVYALPQPASVDAAAWTLAAASSTPQAAFEYKLSLRYWPPGAPDLSVGSASTVTVTGANHGPQDRRHYAPQQPIQLKAFQWGFDARVHHDTQLIERHGALERTQSVGTPLLQGLYLLELVPHTYSINSLHELLLHSTGYQFLEPATPLRRISARMHLPAVLTEGESLSLKVTGAEIRRCEARLDAVRRMRPADPQV